MKPHAPKPPYDGKIVLPGDEVMLKDGRKASVNSAHYVSNDGRQKFSICRDQKGGDELYFSDETTFLHRCHYEQYKGSDQYKCACGQFYTTMADLMNASAPQ